MNPDRFDQGKLPGQSGVSTCSLAKPEIRYLYLSQVDWMRKASTQKKPAKAGFLRSRIDYLRLFT